MAIELKDWHKVLISAVAIAAMPLLIPITFFYIAGTLTVEVFADQIEQVGDWWNRWTK